MVDNLIQAKVKGPVANVKIMLILISRLNVKVLQLKTNETLIVSCVCDDSVNMLLLLF